MNCQLPDPPGFETLCFYLIILISLSSWLQLTPVKLGYGKFVPKGSKFLVSAPLAWFIYESPNLIFSLYFLLYSGFPMKPGNLALLGLFLIHYIHRDLIYPLKLRGNSSKFPLELASSAFFFCIFNGYYQGYSLSRLCRFDEDLIFTWNFIAGIAFFFIGMYINIRSDNILLRLKKRRLEELAKEPPEQGTENQGKAYSIPNEFLFRYVVSPNYFGECLEWLGYGMAGWTLNGFAFFFSTFSILLSRAIKNKQWYRQKFNEFPKCRKAMIPFLI